MDTWFGLISIVASYMRNIKVKKTIFYGVINVVKQQYKVNISKCVRPASWVSNKVDTIYECYKWDRVFKSGLIKFCGRQPLKNLLSPLLNTLSQILLWKYFIKKNRDWVVFCKRRNDFPMNFVESRKKFYKHISDQWFVSIPPWKHRKTSSWLVFSGGKESEHWLEMGWNYHSFTTQPIHPQIPLKYSQW